MAAVKNFSGERKYPILKEITGREFTDPYGDKISEMVRQHREEMKAKFTEAQERKKKIWYRLKRLFIQRRR